MYLYIFNHTNTDIHTHIYLPLPYFSAVPLAKDKDLNGFKFCFVLFFLISEELPYSDKQTLQKSTTNCPRQLHPFTFNALPLLGLWLNPPVRGRAATVCSSPTAQHVTSEIQYIHQFPRPESIIAIKHSPPCCAEQLALLPKSSVPVRLLLASSEVSQVEPSV